MAEQILSSVQVQELIPNRPPYLLLDRAQILESGKRAIGIKNVTLDEPYFSGHFPARPIMPGVLQVEAMTQLAWLTLYAADPGRKGVPFVFSMHKVKFRQPVVPGDLLKVEAELEPMDNGHTLVRASTTCEGNVTSEAELELGFIVDPATFVPGVMAPPLKVGAPVAAMTIEDIMDTIPHRFPFLLIDRVISVDMNEEGTEGTFIGLKNVSINEPMLDAYQGGSAPCLPSSVIPEIAAQAGCAFVLSLPANHGKLAFFMSIDEGTFLRPVLPGDQLLVQTTISIRRGRFGRGDAEIFVGEELVARTAIKFSIADNE